MFVTLNLLRQRKNPQGFQIEILQISPPQPFQITSLTVKYSVDIQFHYNTILIKLKEEVSMALSINQDIKAGKSTYHIQTEYYKTSNKIISNIFKDGKAVKRLEKEVEEEKDLDTQIKEFHKNIVERLTKPTLLKRKKTEKGKFTITDKQEEKIAQVIYPFFGIATSLVISDALRSSSSSEEFIEMLLHDIEEEKADELKKEISSILSEVPEEKSQEETMKMEKVVFPEDKLMEILFPYFGIATGAIVESAKNAWNGKVESLLNFLSKELEEDVKEKVFEQIEELFKSTSSEKPTVRPEEKSTEEKKKEKKLERTDVEKVLPSLSEYFGISASAVAEEAFETSEGKVDKFIQAILQEAEEEQRKELESKLRSILGES